MPELLSPDVLEWGWGWMGEGGEKGLTLGQGQTPFQNFTPFSRCSSFLQLVCYCGYSSPVHYCDLSVTVTMVIPVLSITVICLLLLLWLFQSCPLL